MISFPVTYIFPQKEGAVVFPADHQTIMKDYEILSQPQLNLKSS